MEHSLTTTVDAPPEQVWQLFVDVERWPEMNKSISEARRTDSGPLRVGSEAIIKQRRLPRARWRVTELEPGRSFIWETTTGGVTGVAATSWRRMGRGRRSPSPFARTAQRPGWRKPLRGVCPSGTSRWRWRVSAGPPSRYGPDAGRDSSASR
jgi:uncharacterized protein YndB with AHSA1/START domain